MSPPASSTAGWEDLADVDAAHEALSHLHVERHLCADGETREYAVPASGARPPVSVVRLWWHCRLCGGRFDTFGTAHDDVGAGRAAAAESLADFDRRHRLHLDSLNEALDLLDPARRTSRVVRPTLRHPFDATSSS